jgi:hypothetical protein
MRTMPIPPAPGLRRHGRLRRTVEVGLLAVTLLALPAGAVAWTPYLTVDVSPVEPRAGEPVTIVVRTWADPEHTVPGRDDEWARSFGTAMPTLGNLLVARAEGWADIPVHLRRVEIDRFEGTIALPAGEWFLELFPGRIGWASPSLPPGYPGAIRLTVIEAPRSSAATVTASASPGPVTIDDANECPVTRPGTAPTDFAERLFGSGSAFGSDDLWVGGLGPDGVIIADPRFVEADGSVGWKLGWWRITPGTLTITGRRLDAPAPPLRGEAGDGYGTSGFQASGVYFPTEGCWEVTGTVSGATLTFVTFVLKT